MVGSRKNSKASDTYFRPRDKFYEFLELHETANKETRKKERRGAVFMTIFGICIITLAVVTHENANYTLVSKIFG